MFHALINSEGGLTSAGYIVTIVLAVLALVAAFFLAGKSTKAKKHRPDSWHSAPQRSLWALSLPTSSFPFLSEVPSLPSVCFLSY